MDATEVEMKFAGHEIKALDAYVEHLPDGLCSPLTVCFDYKGFRVQATAEMPIDPSVCPECLLCMCFSLFLHPEWSLPVDTCLMLSVPRVGVSYLVDITL